MTGNRVKGYGALAIVLLLAAVGIALAQLPSEQQTTHSPGRWLFIPSDGGPDASGYLINVKSGELWVLNGNQKIRVEPEKSIPDTSAFATGCREWEFHLGPGRSRWDGYLMCSATGEMWLVNGHSMQLVGPGE